MTLAVEVHSRYNAKTLQALAAVITPRLCQQLVKDVLRADFQSLIQGTDLAAIAPLTLSSVLELFDRPGVALRELEVIEHLAASLSQVSSSATGLVYLALEALIKCSELLVVRQAQGGALTLSVHPEWSSRLNRRQALESVSLAG